MKNLLLFVFLLLGLSLSAQVEKNRAALSFNSFNPGLSTIAGSNPNGLGLAFTTTKFSEDEEGTKDFSGGLSSNVHYFFLKNFSVGFLVNGYLTSSEGEMILLLSTGTELRYYIPIAQKWNFYLKANGMYGKMNVRYDKEWSEYPMTEFSYTAGGGIAFFLAPSASIDLFAGYRNTDWKMEGETLLKISDMVFDIGFTLFLK
ncbi:MAG: outer membrane beta-barrel protein [Lewinellaceae bacterium]|nr:outer membrane beta-barrel protein [Lewinellaceae bacterium]